MSLTNYRELTPFGFAAAALLVLNRKRVLSTARQEF
jgi:hypothetical protein